VQHKQQTNPLLSMNNYTPLLISRDDKNKQITLMSQLKLALTAINTHFALKNHQGVPIKYKNQPRHLHRPSSVNFSKFLKSIS
jgi:hypothetical protein